MQSLLLVLLLVVILLTSLLLSLLLYYHQHYHHYYQCYYYKNGSIRFWSSGVTKVGYINSHTCYTLQTHNNKYSKAPENNRVRLQQNLEESFR